MNNDKMARLLQNSTAYPEIIRPHNQALENRINKLIKQTVEETLPSDRYKKMNIITAAGEYEETVNIKEILSIRFENYYYPEGMANGITEVRGLTVNLITGKKYRLKHLFASENYKSYLNRIIEEQIEEREIPLIEEFTGITGNEVFYLTEEALVIVFQEYELTPGYFGVLEFKIPYQDLKPIIDENSPIYKNLIS
ncbi:RsiV family protein [Sporohalobacter salinus]|uniref:RsiV family protein n=1 Tax=Sporohalobacter salinus TaxID=1494606 RepID=UPI001961AF17|nr:RsiV family protein [Sporohalobacter salinus]MBM7623681.1 hypothetical protein [Sporohalobacter salinus]